MRPVSYPVKFILQRSSKTGVGAKANWGSAHASARASPCLSGLGRSPGLARDPMLVVWVAVGADDQVREADGLGVPSVSSRSWGWDWGILGTWVEPVSTTHGADGLGQGGLGRGFVGCMATVARGRMPLRIRMHERDTPCCTSLWVSRGLTTQMAMLVAELLCPAPRIVEDH